MNGISNMQPVQVKVNQRALIQKVLARYPEEFTVFRELVQNADDAGAENIEIEFQTEEYSREATPTNGFPLDSVDINQMKIFKWIVRNDGTEFTQKDWDRLTNIADGNPDEQKIGASGVGFYSVFSVTECPLVISGDHQKELFYQGDQLMILPGACQFTKGVVIEMKVKEEMVHIPKPFDLSRFLCTAVTFLTKVENVTVLFDGHALSKIQRVRGTPEKIEALPKELKRNRNPGAILTVESVEMIPQQIRVTLAKAAYTAGTTKSRFKKAVKESANPIKHVGFFGTKDVLLNGHVPIPRSLSVPDERTSVVNYTIYSATVSSAPTAEVIRGLEAATKKNPPRSFLCEVLYFDMDQHARMMQDGDDGDGLGSVFRGAQALCSEFDERTGKAYGSRLFIGQSTAQTSSIATLLCSRFIPTVERGSVDLANGYVADWNKEILYAGGFVARLIYERAMKDIRDQWPESPGPRRDRLREEALYVTKSFTFKSSTPDPKIGELLQNAFFECSDGDLFPILANLGIRNSKDVRQPHPDFRSFMKDRPVLDDDLWKEESTLAKQLPKPYNVRTYTFGDVKDELDGRVMAEEEMIRCIDWWVKTVDAMETKGTSEKIQSYWKLAAPVAKFRSRNSPRIVNLSRINKFVNRSRFSFLKDEDPLPSDTIPISFTNHLNPDKIVAALGWEYLTLVDWIRHLVTSGLDKPQDICRDETFGLKVLGTLQDLWHSIEPTDQDTIIKLMQMVPCIATNRGHQKPQDVYFPEVDLFNELPVLLPDFLLHDHTRNKTVLDALGVHRFLPWDHVKDRLLSNKECSMMRLAIYLDAVRRYMVEEEFMGVKELPIFSCESDEKRRCIGELYRPDPLNISLGLPVLAWDGSANSRLGMDILNELGLLPHPPLDTIIQKACSEDANVRRTAWNFFLGHLDDHYERYDPDSFPDAPFLPCTSGGRTLFSTPEKVYTSSDWETFGFCTIQKAIPVKTRMKLKVKDKPSADAIIKAIMSQPKPDERKAKGWFELLAKSGGFSTDKLAALSEMDIVPVPPAPGTNSRTVPPRYTSPSKCFYELPVASKAHHRMIFTYVNFKEPGNSFLKMCGAKGNPDCSDIVNAMIENPQEYLNNIEAYIEKQPKSDNQTHKIYLDDLRQVAAGYHGLPQDLRTRMKTAPIFMSFRKKVRTTDGPSKTDSKEYALKPANEILIPDDLESHRLFGEYIYVAPKEEVFENFYRDHESESLSQHVKHKVMPKDPIGDAGDLYYHVLDRLKIFLFDQESARRSDFEVSRWEKSGAFTVKYCKQLEISKSLEFKYVTLPDSMPLRSIKEPALAGIQHTEECDTLWVEHSEGCRQDWYDISVALCRVIFDQHKIHDMLLLMTILDSNLDDLRRRGYDIDQIRDHYDEEAQRADQVQDAAYGHLNRVTIPLTSFFFPFDWLRNRKKKTVSEEYVYSNMESMINEALSMCESDADMKRSLNADRSKQKGGKKKANVRYCGSHQVDLERCKIVGKKGMLVYKSHGSEDPPASEVGVFSVILDELGKLFNLGPEKLHIFWYQQDLEMMGFNRNRAIYLNLAHFTEKHADWNSNDVARATMYTAWYFIIAHEIAHNKAFFHDEDHELLFSSIAQHRLVAFKKLLDKRAPGAK